MAIYRWYLSRCVSASGMVLLCLLATTAVAAFVASRVHVDARLEALLSPDSESMRDLAAMSERGPSGVPLQLIVASDNVASNRRVAESLASELRTWPSVRWAEARRDAAALRAKEVLIVPADVLEEWADTLESTVIWEQCQRMPGCVQLDDRPDDIDVDVVRERILNVPEIASLSRVLGESAESLESAGTVADGDERGWLCSAAGDVCVVDASVDSSARDVDVATELLDRAEALAARAASADGTEGMRIAVSGPIRNAAMNKRVAASDLQRVSAWSALLVALILLAQFRGARWAVVILVPVVSAAAITLAVVAAIGVSLNLVASFGFTILIGVGVDFGIHMATHYRVLRGRVQDVPTAVTQALEGLGNSLAVAAMTTAVAFFALTFASFPGFAQMGWVAGTGVVVAWLAYLLWFPALVIGLDRLLPEKHKPVAAKPPQVRKPPSLPRGRLVVFGGLALAAVSGWLAMRITVEEDFRRLQPEGIAHGIATGDALRGTQGVFVHLYGEDPSSVQAAALDLESRLRGRFGPGGDEPGDVLALTAAAFAPEEQPRRLAAVLRIHEQLEELPTNLDSALRAQVDRLKPLFAVSEPLRPEDLPPFIQDALVDARGRLGNIALIVLKTSGSDARPMMRLSRIMSETRQAHPGVAFASPSALLGEVLPGLYRDGPLVVALALLGLALSTFALSRRVTQLVLVLSAVAVTTSVTGGVLYLIGMKLNLYNMVILPAAFGIAIDGAVYMVWARVTAPDDPARADVDVEHEGASRSAILGSTLTTLAAFGSLATSAHPGVASLGVVGAVAIAVAAIVNLGWLPALLDIPAVGRRLSQRNR